MSIEAYQYEFIKTCFDRLYGSSSSSSSVSVLKAFDASLSSDVNALNLSYMQPTITLNPLSVNYSSIEKEIDENTILELAIIKDIQLLREIQNVFAGKVNIADQIRILGITQKTIDLFSDSELDDSIKSWFKSLKEHYNNGVDNENEFVLVGEDRSAESAIGTLIREEKKSQLTGKIRHLSDGTVNQTTADGWIIEEDDSSQRNDINIFFMGTAGAPLFAGHFDIYEGGDVLCNLALQKALEEKKRVMLMRGVGTAVMSLDQPLVYLDHYDSRHNDKLAVTEGDVAGNLLGSGIEARITAAMEMHFIPEMIQLIKNGQENIKVNVTGHSRGAITSFAMADCMDKWVMSLLAYNESELRMLAKNINNNIQTLTEEEIFNALVKLQNKEIKLETKLLAYDPVEGRAGLGNIKDGYLGWTANYNLPIYGKNIAFTYEEMPNTVTDAFVLLANADYREAFQPTIPTFDENTKQKIISVVGGHGTMKGNLSDHSNTGQDSYKTAQHNRFIKEAGRAAIEAARLDAIEYLFDKYPPFQTVTLLNIFTSNANEKTEEIDLSLQNSMDESHRPNGYLRTKAKLLTHLGIRADDFNEKYVKPLLELKLGATLDDSVLREIKKLFSDCQEAMRGDTEDKNALRKELYFLMRKDIHELYFDPKHEDKQNDLGAWFDEMKRDTTNAGISLITTDAEKERYVWVRSKNNGKQHMPLSKLYAALEYQPKKQIWYPETSYIGGVDESKNMAHKFNNPYWFDFEEYFLRRGISTEGMSDELSAALISTSMQFLDLNEIGMRLLYAPSHPELLRAFEEKSAAFIKHVQENADYPDDIKIEIIAVFKMKAIHQYKIDESVVNKIITDNEMDINLVDQKMHSYQLKTISRLVEKYPKEPGATSRRYGKILKEAQKLLKQGVEKGWIKKAMAVDGNYEDGRKVWTGFYECSEKIISGSVARLLTEEKFLQQHAEQFIRLSRQLDKHFKAIHANEMLGYKTKLGAFSLGFFSSSKRNTGSFKTELEKIQDNLSRLSITELNAQKQLTLLEDQLKQVSENNKKDLGSLLESSTLQRYDLSKEIIKKISTPPDVGENKEGQIRRVLREECSKCSANSNDVLCEVFLQCLKKDKTLIYAEIMLNSDLWEDMKQSSQARLLLQEVLNGGATTFNQGLIRDLVSKNFEHNLFNGAILHEIVQIDETADLVVELLKTPEGKAQCNALNDNGETILHILAKNGRWDVLDAIENCEALKGWSVGYFTATRYQGIFNMFGVKNFHGDGLQIVENKEGLSPIMCAVFSGAPYEDICKIIDLFTGTSVKLDPDNVVTYKKIARYLQDKSPEERDALKEKFKQDKNLQGFLVACDPTQSSSSSNAVAPKKGWW